MGYIVIINHLVVIPNVALLVPPMVHLVKNIIYYYQYNIIFIMSPFIVTINSLIK